MPAPAPAHRDLVVIGASAGGVDAVPKLLAALPADLPAIVLVVQHQPADAPVTLVDILARHSPLPVVLAADGAALERAHVYVAPPDRHLLLGDGRVRLSDGPRERYSRPAIDPTMRAAAELYGPRAIGVVLTGMLDDGAAGLAAIRAAGGRALVEDPSTAAFPAMPTSALRIAGADRVLPLAEIAAALAELVTEVAPVPPIGWRVARDARLVELAAAPDVSPAPSLACPECAGPMRDDGEPRARVYRCALGHTISAAALCARADDDIAAAFWAAERALHDRAAMLEILACDAERSGDYVAASLHRRARSELADAITQLRGLALDLGDRTRKLPA